MKLFFSILLCKILRVLLKIIGKGSSFPGQIVLKLFPNVLSKIKLPKYVIAVTGSNGKTSTVELIYNILSNNGFRVAYNYEGSNQIEGVATLLLNDCSLSGKCKSDVCLLEIDERYAEKIFKHFNPTHLIVTNLFRDQQTRNGNREWVYSCIEKAIHGDYALLLNADDPLTSLLNEKTHNAIYYGIDKQDNLYNLGVFDDGVCCPKCGMKMIYDYRHFDNLGSFKCSSCNHKKQSTKYSLSKLNLDEGYMIVDDDKILLSFPSIYIAYNMLSAYSLARELNIDKDRIVESLNNYVLKNRRIVEFNVNNKKGIFLASKHENPTSYNQSLSFVSKYKKDVSVLIVVDKISRKYFTSETSWLWDVDFDILKSNNVKKIILSGKYVNDLALRFAYSDVDNNIIEIHSDILDGVKALSNSSSKDLFIITCFSDQDNVLGKVNQL